MVKKEILTQELLDSINEGIFQTKGEKIVRMDMSKLETAICDYFIICEGDSNIHVNSIANSVEKQVKEDTKTFPLHKSGYENAQWILLDYGNIVVHVFQKEYREFYKLEELWADAPINTIKDELKIAE